MTTLKDYAKAYEPKQTKNIADLKEVVLTGLELHDRTGVNSEGKEFEYKVIIVDDDEYRIPNTVIADLKAILEKKPSLTKFSVTKKGQGFNTEYTVIPLD